MEIALLGAGSLLGYLYNQNVREKNFQEENSVNLRSYANSQYAPFNNPNYYNSASCPQNYPVYSDQSDKIQFDANGQYNYVNYINNSYKKALNNQMMRGNQNGNYIQPPAPTNLPPNFPSAPMPPMPPIQQMPKPSESSQSSQSSQPSRRIEGFQNTSPSIPPSRSFSNQTMLNEANYIPANDPNAVNLIDNFNKRPIADFTHNNMVPFFGAKVTQSMAGTGVASGDYTDGVTVDSGFDKTTPNQSKLAMFTGVDDTYLSKREVGPMYSPAEQQTNWVYKPLFREDVSQYTQSLHVRNDLRPVEPIQVGRGLNLDPSIPAAGGFHEFTRVMPNNVTDYKANQLENRVNAGKWVSGGNLPESYPGIGTGPLASNPNSQKGRQAPGVPNNRAPRDWSQVRRPTMTTKVGFVSNFEELRSDYNVDKRPMNPSRDDTSYGYGKLNNVTSNGGKNVEGFANGVKSGGNGAMSGGYIESGGKNGEICVGDSPIIGIAPSRPGAMLTARDPIFMSQDDNIRSVSDCNSLPIGNPNRPGQQSGPLLNKSSNC